MRIFFVVLLAALFTTAAPGSYAKPIVSLRQCQSVSVAGGDDNAMTAGVLVAHVFVKNIGLQTCEVIGRPWIRIPRISYPITVTDLSTGPGAGTPSGRVVLTPGTLASAEILLIPGRCSRDRSVVFPVMPRAGWRNSGVRLGGSLCQDGSGQISVSTFRPA
jgi:hypothetical protein